MQSCEFSRNKSPENKFTDFVRDDWSLDPNVDSATFGDDTDTRWDHFIHNPRF